MAGFEILITLSHLLKEICSTNQLQTGFYFAELSVRQKLY